MFKNISKLNKSMCVMFAPLFLLAACGGGSDSPAPESGAPNNNQSFLDFLDSFDDDEECDPVDASCFFDLRPGIDDSHVVTQFDGIWTGTCRNFEGGLSQVITMEISGQSGTETQRLFTDTSCTSPAIPAVREADLDIFYSSIFTDGIVGVNNTVLANVTASDIRFDGAQPSEDQEAALQADGSFRTFFTAFRLSDDTTTFFQAVPSGFSDGSNADDRTFDFDFNSSGLVRQ